MIHKIRAILDVEKDVIRDILIDDNENLETLHLEVAKAFGFNGQEIASFYRTDNEWNQGEEIPLFDMSEDGQGASMQNCLIKDIFSRESDKLIYVYDFMAMWTFFIELKEKDVTTEKKLPTIAFAFGDVPETAPEKEFIADNLNQSFDFDDDDELGGFDEFDNIDDYDF